MGYYKDRIKGSNYEKLRNRFSWGVVIVSSIIGILTYYGPVGQKFNQAIKDGWLDDPQWRKDKKAYWQAQFTHPEFTPFTREELEDRKQDKEDRAFPRDVLQKPDTKPTN